MVFEYMEHGDLADLLRRNDPAIGRGQSVELKQVPRVSTYSHSDMEKHHSTSKIFIGE